MKFFLDTASLDDLRRWQAFGLVDGCTTNPALLAREGGNPLEQLAAVAALVDGPVSAQVTCSDARGMLAQGRALAAIAANIVVKIPATKEGFQAARGLTELGIDVNVTLTFQPAQAIPFVRIPVRYVSLIVGRVEDFGLDSRAETERARRMFDQIGTTTQLLVASLRNPEHICAAVAGGADVLTVPPATWELVHGNPLSLAGEADFHAAWTKLPAPLRTSYDQIGATTLCKKAS